MTAIIKPAATTTRRRMAGEILPAMRPPSDPPTRAPTIMTRAADHTTFPENRKKTATAILAKKQ